MPVTLILRIFTQFLKLLFISELRSFMRLTQFSLLYHYFNPSFIASNLLLPLPMMIIEHPAVKINSAGFQSSSKATGVAFLEVDEEEIK